MSQKKKADETYWHPISYLLTGDICHNPALARSRRYVRQSTLPTCPHEEAKHPEVTKLKWQVRTIFKKGACQITKGKTNPLEKGDCDYPTELQQEKSKTDTEEKGNNVR